MDNWNILLENNEDGSTIATVLEVPELKTIDKTKQGAVKKVRQLLQNRLAKAEIIQIFVICYYYNISNRNILNRTFVNTFNRTNKSFLKNNQFSFLINFFQCSRYHPIMFILL